METHCSLRFNPWPYIGVGPSGIFCPKEASSPLKQVQCIERVIRTCQVKHEISTRIDASSMPWGSLMFICAQIEQYWILLRKELRQQGTALVTLQRSQVVSKVDTGANTKGMQAALTLLFVLFAQGTRVSVTTSCHSPFL